MRRAILILGLLLGACGGATDDGGEPVELLPAAEREGGDQCTEGAPVDAQDVYAVLMACADAGDLPIVDSAFGTLCWSMDWNNMSDECRAAYESMPGNEGTCEDVPHGDEAPDPSACRQISNDVWCLVGIAVDCEMNDSQSWCATHDCVSKKAPGCETPEAINERAAATVEAICG